MASPKTRKRKKRKTVSLLNDERLPKIAGIFCLFLGLYLTIAFVSYFFTWKNDQSVVLNFSWNLFMQHDLTVDNWLGRLGAFISNGFFYFGFGLPSLIIVYILSKFGLALIRKTPLKTIMNTIANSVLLMAFLSIILEFFLHKSEFSWGGQFGYSVYLWMSNFGRTMPKVALYRI